MNKRWAALVLMAAVLLAACLAVGCGGGSGENGESNGDMPGKMTGESKDVSVGEEFEIELESNPSTGYEWTMTTRPDEAILGLTRDEFVPSDSTAVGAPGKHIWRFKALAAGKTTIVLEYARSWEEDEKPRQVHTVTVEVK